MHLKYLLQLKHILCTLELGTSKPARQLSPLVHRILLREGATVVVVITTLEMLRGADEIGVQVRFGGSISTQEWIMSLPLEPIADLEEHLLLISVCLALHMGRC